MSIAKAMVTRAVHSLAKGEIIKNELKCFFKTLIGDRPSPSYKVMIKIYSNLGIIHVIIPTTV